MVLVHGFGRITIDVLLVSDLPFRFEWTLEGSDGTPNQDFRCSQCGPCLGYLANWWTTVFDMASGRQPTKRKMQRCFQLWFRSNEAERFTMRNVLMVSPQTVVVGCFLAGALWLMWLNLSQEASIVMIGYFGRQRHTPQSFFLVSRGVTVAL